MSGDARCICGRGDEFAGGHAAFCNLPAVLERDGLAVGDRVRVRDQFGVVVGFPVSPCDVTLTWSSGANRNVCRRHVEVVKVDG